MQITKSYHPSPEKQYKYTLMVYVNHVILGEQHVIPSSSRMMHTIHRKYGLAAHDSTNNVAEYIGLIKALGCSATPPKFRKKAS
jgi:hypothetical protein